MNRPLRKRSSPSLDLVWPLSAHASGDQVPTVHGSPIAATTPAPVSGVVRMLSTSPTLRGNRFALARGTCRAFLACQQCHARRCGRWPRSCTCARHEILGCLPSGHERWQSVRRNKTSLCRGAAFGCPGLLRGSMRCGPEDACLRHWFQYRSRRGTQGPARRADIGGRPDTMSGAAQKARSAGHTELFRETVESVSKSLPAFFRSLAVGARVTSRS